MLDEHTATPILVMGRHRLHELALLLYSLLIGICYVTHAAPVTPVVAARLPSSVLWLWMWAWLLSGLTGLVGAVLGRRRIITGLRLEQGAMLLGAAPLLIYITTVIDTVHTLAAWAGMGVLMAWTAANLGRARQIHTDLGRLQQRRRLRQLVLKAARLVERWAGEQAGRP